MKWPEGVHNMAQRVHVTLEDDIDGSEAAETIQFGLDGVSYEIDLSDANAAQLRDSLSKWVGHARRVGGRKQQARTTSARNDLNEIREWGRANGYKVSDRGRVSADVLKAFDAAKG
jgi:hypothetical protein